MRWVTVLAFTLVATMSHADYCPLSPETIAQNDSEFFADILGPKGEWDFREKPMEAARAKGNKCKNKRKIGHLTCKFCFERKDGPDKEQITGIKKFEVLHHGVHKEFRNLECQKRLSQFNKCGNLMSSITNRTSLVAGLKDGEDFETRDALRRSQERYNSECLKISSWSPKKCLSLKEKKPNEILLKFENEMIVNCSLKENKSVSSASLRDVTFRKVLKNHNIQALRANQCPTSGNKSGGSTSSGI